MFLWEENPWHPWPTIERERCDVVRLLREGRHWHGRYWWQFTRQTCETTCVKASFDELKDRTIWSSSMYLQQSLEMMRWCIISRSLESIEYYPDNSKSHDFLMSKYLRRYCLNRIEHELFARCFGQNIQTLLRSLLSANNCTIRSLKSFYSKCK